MSENSTKTMYATARFDDDDDVKQNANNQNKTNS